MARILIVDDDLAFGTSLLGLLSSAGFTAYFHRTPFGTLDAVRRTRCDLVVLDVNMPRLDGGALARMIREFDVEGRVSVMLCSDMESSMLERAARLVGAQGSVAKSAGLDGVLRAIELSLGKRRDSVPPRARYGS